MSGTVDAPALSALAQRVRAGDPDRFEAALFAPPEPRERLFTLYAFNLELAQSAWRAAHRVTEPQIGAIRMRWWLDVIEEAAGGAPPRAHEIAEPLAALIRAEPALAEPLARMTEARLRDLDPAPMESDAAFDAYVADTAGALTLAAAQAAARSAARASARVSEPLDRAAQEIGFALGVARVLEASAALAAHGRLLLPVEDPRARAACLRGQTTPPLSRSVNRAAAAGLAALAGARARRRAVPAEAAPALLAAWRAERVLRLAARPDVDLFRDLTPESPFRRRAGLLWRGLSGRW